MYYYYKCVFAYISHIEEEECFVSMEIGPLTFWNIHVVRSFNYIFLYIKLVVSISDFGNEMQNFVTWKKDSFSWINWSC
jgi:hypothetical protein